MSSFSHVYLHELKGGFKLLNGIHLHPEKLHTHYEADGALDHVRALLFLTELLQLTYEPLFNRRKSTKKKKKIGR